MTDAPEILIDRAAGVGVVTLNRPQALNALTLAMVRGLDRQLAAWADDRSVRIVVIRGAGERAFCAGGDIRALYESGRSKTDTLTADFYREEYHLNRRIKRYPKPYVALMDGVTLGGGVGVSVHGSHRVVTERTLFAMPETGIGLFPDVGGTYFLPRCPGRIGTYLGLSGARLKAADCHYAGLATHAVPSARLDELVAALRHPGLDTDAREIVDEVLSEFAEAPGPPPLVAHREAIDRCFAAPNVEAIEAALGAEGGEWAQATLKAMAEKSPLCQKVTRLAIARGADLGFEDCMVMEYRLVQRAMAAHDFYEGVRAAVIDKDRSPRWRPASLAKVSDAEVEAWFAPLGAEDLVFDEC
ncbi:MAG: enoyl-CoA hydratase/isomerase family protein [Alphaproteobacteria bacterium]